MYRGMFDTDESAGKEAWRMAEAAKKDGQYPVFHRVEAYRTERDYEGGNVEFWLADDDGLYSLESTHAYVDVIDSIYEEN